MINGDHSVLETVAVFFVSSVITERFHSIENAHKDRPPDQKCCGDFAGPDQTAKRQISAELPETHAPPSIDVFYQIRRLALQEPAQCFEVVPRHTFPFSQLLESRFAEQLLASDFVRCDSFLFQCGNHIHFVLQTHNEDSFPMITSLYHKYTRNQVYNVHKKIH